MRRNKFDSTTRILGPWVARALALSVIWIALLWEPLPAQAYIGPGAGIAFVSSFLVVLVTLVLAVFTLLTWPIRWVAQTIRSRGALRKSRTKRVVVVGLDGQDPELTEQFMKAGLLPNFKRLQESGSYRRLRTSLPAESPVAWSCFQTGSNPGRHRVFDFLVPNRKSYMPELCSARIEPPARSISFGRYRIPIGKPGILFERKSQSFWKILGDFGVFSIILRVPISFPPEKFKGLLLSAMSAPDLLGTQGTFSYYSTDAAETDRLTGGVHIPVIRNNGSVSAVIRGPENPVLKEPAALEIPFTVKVSNNGIPSQLQVNGKAYPLPLREFTPWIPLEFKGGLGMKVQGISRFYLLEAEPHLKLYMSPVNIAPDAPALPISQPLTYSMYLAKTQGKFCTLGLAEDTWALNERVLDEEAFLKQAYLVHEEREKMLFDAIEKTKRGTVVCVFDITDRLQHMFFRYLDPDHPANEGKDTTVHRDAIQNLYVEMDRLVGRVMESLDDEAVLVVMSDHGFKPFKRGVNLNSWLHQNGYLVLKEEPSGKEWFEGVDWSKTRAYAVGFGGIYLNVKGRESQGIVGPGYEAYDLKREIIGRLKGLVDPERDAVAVKEVYDTQEVFSGPYVHEGPNLIVGFSVGYRVSWTCATGAVTREVFEDNTRSWSGDHTVNPPDVPGILFVNRPVSEEDPSIMDIGPSVLDLFGVPVPDYFEGRPIIP